MKFMGNTLSAAAQTIKRCAQYILFAADENEIWRYPRLNLRREGREVAADIETILEVAHVRISLVRDQVVKICWHMEENARRLWSIAYRLWRIAYHITQLADEVGAEVAEMCLRVPRVLLELVERGREVRKT